jgi:prevent-host-death family protein
MSQGRWLHVSNATRTYLKIVHTTGTARAPQMTRDPAPVLTPFGLSPYYVVTYEAIGGVVKFTNVRELKAKTSQMLRTVEKGNTVLVTTHGRPTAMLVPVTEDDIEDVLLAHSPQLRKKIEVGLRDIRAGRTMPLAEYLNRRTTRKAKRS